MRSRLPGVGLSAELVACLQDPSFWLSHHTFGDHERWKGHDGWRVTAEVGGGYTLVLEIKPPGVMYLGWQTPGREEQYALGWIDGAHPFPHALRWAELDLIGRAAALTDPGLRHPGPLLALAGDFVVLGAGDEVDPVVPMMSAAFGSAPADAEYWPMVGTWLYRHDRRRNGCTWNRDDTGNWTVSRDPGSSFNLYSCRETGEPGFAAEQWRDLLAAAHRTVAQAVPEGPRLAAGDPPTRAAATRDLTLAAELGRVLADTGCDNEVLLRGLTAPNHHAEVCWILETLIGAPQGSLVARWFGPSPLRDGRVYRLELSLQVRQQPDWYEYAEAAIRDLNAALSDADRGQAFPENGSLREYTIYDWVPTVVSVSVMVHGDLEEGIELIRDVCSRHDAGPDTTLRHAGAAIPLGVDGPSIE